MKKVFLFAILLCMQSMLFAQQDLYFGLETSGGILGGTQPSTNLLDQKNYSPTLGATLNLNFRMFDLFALEAGIGQHWSRVRLRDGDFEKEVEDFSINIKNTNFHWNYYAAISSFIRLKKTDSYIYGKFAISQNIYKAATESASSSFQVSNLNIDRNLDYSTTYQESNMSFIPEIGIQHKFYKGSLLSLGLKYNIGQSQAFESTYTVTDNITQESRSDQVSSKGNAVSLCVRFEYRLKHFDKKEKIKKLDLDEIALDMDKKVDEEDDKTSQNETIDTAVVVNPPSDTVVTQPPPVDTTASGEPDLRSVGDRELSIRDKINVHAKKVIITIWDNQTVDGDRVSLNLNGKWILENYELVKNRLELEVELEEGINTFVLYALNLGKIPPNTAAIMVDDGDKKHRLTLQSNMKKSGTLQIKYKKPKDENK